jgi:ornithine cyclodeaminase/alanine dehydrogenase-like protein (mu-crystallin family)
VRPIGEIRVFSRTAERRNRFCAELAAEGLPTKAVPTAEAAVRDADVVVTATTATEPVVLGRWLQPGAHINAVGANYEHRRELDSEVVARSAVIVTDDREQARYEATDLAAPVAEGMLTWDRVRGLDELVAGLVPGRVSRDDITLFESLGVALGDVALAARAYEKALRAGIGERLPNLSGRGSP